MFPVLFTRFFDSGVNGTWIAKTTSLEALYDFLWRMCNVPVTTVLAMVILVAASIVLLISVVKNRCALGNIGILTLFWTVPLLVSFVLSYFTGFFLDRYFYFLFPVFYLSMAAYCLYLFPKRKVLGLSLMALLAVAMLASCSPDSSTKRFSGWHHEVKPIAKQLVAAKEKENALVVLPEYFEKQFAYYLDENHEVFRTQSQPVDYYVFHDYLCKAGYYYDCNYAKADLTAYSKVVFTYREAMPVNGLREYLESAGFQMEWEEETYPFVVCCLGK